MDLQEIKRVAKEKGVNNPADNKTDLIRQIQVAEGYSPCFSTEKRKDCDQMQCLWRGDCVVPGAQPVKQSATAPQASKECCKSVTPPQLAKPEQKPSTSQGKSVERKLRKK